MSKNFDYKKKIFFCSESSETYAQWFWALCIFLGGVCLSMIGTDPIVMHKNTDINFILIHKNLSFNIGYLPTPYGWGLEFTHRTSACRKRRLKEELWGTGGRMVRASDWLAQGMQFESRWPGIYLSVTGALLCSLMLSWDDVMPYPVVGNWPISLRLRLSGHSLVSRSYQWW